MTANSEHCECVSKLVAILVLVAFTAGCVTMKPLPATDAGSLASQLAVGDRIKITRNDDTDVTFDVSAVSDDGISGNGVFVAYSDIQQVQVRQPTDAKTIGIVAGIGILVALVAAGGGGSGGTSY